jgi:uncharacterized protein (TIGR03083 family)
MASRQLSRDEAVAVLTRGHDEVAALLAGLSDASAERPGLGGGEWSVKDLLGHLTSWEEYALAALDAWAAGETAPIDRALRRDGLDSVNLAAVEAKASRAYEAIRGDFEAVHSRLLARLREMTDETWNAPPTSRFRRSLGMRLGSMLVGASGPFAHADSHLPDLAALVSTKADH